MYTLLSVHDGRSSFGRKYAEFHADVRGTAKGAKIKSDPRRRENIRTKGLKLSSRYNLKTN